MFHFPSPNQPIFFEKSKKKFQINYSVVKETSQRSKYEHTILFY